MAWCVSLMISISRTLPLGGCPAGRKGVFGLDAIIPTKTDRRFLGGPARR